MTSFQLSQHYYGQYLNASELAHFFFMKSSKLVKGKVDFPYPTQIGLEITNSLFHLHFSCIFIPLFIQ